MSHPYLLFCPYLPLAPDKQPVVFADWELGPLEAFEDRWADSRFKEQAITFLDKFVDPRNKRIDNPALLCRKGKQLDGQQPTSDELKALELSLVFAVVDRNPRGSTENSDQGWRMVTADNAELHAWLIDLDKGCITLTTGGLVEVRTGGNQISDPDLVLPPPPDLHIPISATSPDPLVLNGIYKTVLSSLRSPDEYPTAIRVRVAVEWFAKAWLNSTVIKLPERLVYLKTAFEALTGTSDSWGSAKELRKIFEALPNTTKEDSGILVWSPEEKPVHLRTYKTKPKHITDLQHWFMAFGDTRNEIIHDGVLSKHSYSGSNRYAYHGSFFCTSEFLLRAVIKVLLSSELGYENVWRPDYLRISDAVWESLAL